MLPQQVFEEKARRAGFSSQWLQGRHLDLIHFSLDTLALIWPEKAYAFNRVVLNGLSVGTVADELRVSERTVQRHLHGHKDDMGADDWFLIILEIYREADVTGHQGASVLRSSFGLTTSHNIPIGSFHRSLFLALVEAGIGGDISHLDRTLPWRQAPGATVGASFTDSALAWPVHSAAVPLERSRLPGVIVLMQRCSSEELFRLNLLMSLLSSASNEQWRRHSNHGACEAVCLWPCLLSILNSGGPGNVARNASIPADLVRSATNSAVSLLSRISTPHNFALCGVLALSDVPWMELCKVHPDSHLRELEPSDRLGYCFQRFMQL